MLGQKKKERGATVPRLVRQRIISEYLSGAKTTVMLSEEYSISRDSITKMVERYRKSEKSINFETKPILTPMRPKKVIDETNESLRAEVQSLRRQLELAKLKLEGYEIMGDILHEQYGVDLLKKAGAKQYRNSKRNTQK